MKSQIRWYGRTVTNPYEIAEIAARVEYGKMPWARRVVTPPPVGWPGGHLARAIAWGRSHRVHRREVPEADPA